MTERSRQLGRWCGVRACGSRRLVVVVVVRNRGVEVRVKRKKGGSGRVGIWAGPGCAYWGRVSVSGRKEGFWVIPSGICDRRKGRKKEEVYEMKILGDCRRPFPGI